MSEEQETKTVAINKCYGGFELSPKAIQLYLNKTGRECFFYKHVYPDFNNEYFEEKYVKINFNEVTKPTFFVVTTKDFGPTLKIVKNNKHFWNESFHDDRENKELIETIKELGTEVASGRLSKIQLVDIPADIDYIIDDYDGIETIHEEHMSW